MHLSPQTSKWSISLADYLRGKQAYKEEKKTILKIVVYVHMDAYIHLPFSGTVPNL